MGCASSKPEPPPVDNRLLEARTENTETWDADFRLPRVSKLDRGAGIADTTYSVSTSNNHRRVPYWYCVMEMRFGNLMDCFATSCKSKGGENGDRPPLRWQQATRPDTKSQRI